MKYFEYENSPYPIRDDIKHEHAAYWQRLSSAGSWWTGSQRVAIAQEVRAASSCSFCEQRKNALSPYSFEGKHDSISELDELAVDAVHRIVTDQTRITQAWIDQLAKQGISNEAYVELAGVVVAVFSIDEFHRGLGLEVEPLPQAVEGEPSHYRPEHTENETGFVPMVSLAGIDGPETDMFPGGRSANVLRALSLVPNAVREWMALGSAQYLSVQGMGNMIGQDDRSINRMQMELVAGRVSSINECFY